MAEFQEVAKAYIRMCESYPTCEGCPIQVVGNDPDTCCCVVLKWPSKYESKIMAWAAENPEPIYPSWVEWLYSQGLMTDVIDGKGGSFLYNIAREPIPADIAQKLGLEPK